MSKSRKDRRDGKLRDEIARLKAVLHAVHDHIHNGRLNEAHEALHCDACENAEKALNGQNISVRTAGEVYEFAERFNDLCADIRVNACAVMLLPSAVRQGYVSVQMCGSVDAINYVRGQMGKAPTVAVGDH